MHCEYGDWCPYRTYLYVMKNLCRRGKFKDTEKVIRYRPFGIGIGTDIVFGISVSESTAGGTEIPNFIRHFQLWIKWIYLRLHLFIRWESEKETLGHNLIVNGPYSWEKLHMRSRKTLMCYIPLYDDLPDIAQCRSVLQRCDNVPSRLRLMRSIVW